MLSIITITYNDNSGLKLTLESLSPLSQLTHEVIVVSGNPESYVSPVIDKYKKILNIKCIFDINQGIYHAMNSGINRATFEYLWFLNGGDQYSGFPPPEEFFNILSSNSSDVILFDSLELYNSKLVLKLARPSCVFCTLPTRHQSIIFNVNSLSFKYQTYLQYSGDVDYYLNYKKSGASFLYVNKPLSVFDTQGMSTSFWHASLLETCSVFRKHKFSLGFVFVLYTRYLLANIFRVYLYSIYSRLFLNENKSNNNHQ